MDKKVLVAGIVLLGLAGIYSAGRPSVADQHAVVSGVAVTEGLARQGDRVKAGDVLVRVKSLAGGSIAAARAATAGQVTQVLVQPGDKIAAQQVVAKISE